MAHLVGQEDAQEGQRERQPVMEDRPGLDPVARADDDRRDEGSQKEEDVEDRIVLPPRRRGGAGAFDGRGELGGRRLERGRQVGHAGRA